MRILVLSDSHGCVEPMEQCVERVQPQVILHLGDCVRDAQRLEERYPQIPLLGVPGNCDYGGLDQPERLTELGGVRILMPSVTFLRPASSAASDTFTGNVIPLISLPSEFT